MPRSLGHSHPFGRANTIATSAANAPAWSVFFGGCDLEMVEISRLLADRPDVALFDRGLRWGASAFAYREEILAAINLQSRPVLVELADDLPADFPRDTLIWIDHHGALAGADRPTSIEQVFTLLDFPADAWTRDLSLVAANDRGHIAAMRQFGATPVEIREIRQRDRRAQGVTDEQERQGRRAAEAAETLLDGRLTVVHLSHARTATVTDALDPALGGPGFENLLVISQSGETNFFGSGRAVAALDAAFPGGWSGGELPARGFWGIARPLALAELLPLLEQRLMTLPASEVKINQFHHILVWPLILRGHLDDDITE